MAECISTGRLLGGSEVLPVLPENPLQWVEVIRHGISSASLVLVDALRRSLEVAQQIAAMAVIVEAKDSGPRASIGISTSCRSSKPRCVCSCPTNFFTTFENHGGNLGVMLYFQQPAAP